MRRRPSITQQLASNTKIDNTTKLYQALPRKLYQAKLSNITEARKTQTLQSSIFFPGYSDNVSDYLVRFPDPHYVVTFNLTSDYPVKKIPNPPLELDEEIS